MIHNYTSEYKNVLLKPLTESDIENLRLWRNDSNNSKYLRQIPFITSDMQKKWFENYLVNKDEICFSINEIEELNRVVGSLSLYDFDGRQAEFGKILIGDSEAHGKSIGFNSIKAVLKIAFEELKLDKVVLHVYDENVVARHIYEKAGFVKKSCEEVNGMTENYMEIFRSDYLEKQSNMD